MEKIYESFREIFKNKNLTPVQYYFPYFFREEKFRRAIAEYGLTTKVELDEKLKMASGLKLIRNNKELISFDFGTQLQIDSNNILIFWQTSADYLKISVFHLLENSQQITPSLEIDLTRLRLGLNQIPNKLNLTDFITYVRKSDLQYDQEFFDNYVLVLINGNEIELIPFDWFNKKGGDYGYVWPALARIDKKNNKLIGEGMRMDKFEIDLRNKY